ncbi:hypothetical protein T07_8843 [Trichinella nelsoni]|uniref:Uncharacterized protein n=1 Tax=Trichinella nelsoni TaxID=6336 RepID=A0A0V0RMS3_9BILA|nr:hypothetical protein T07_15033 [Trichinella nelsoni]KRX16106.1 hypothetical protein T07_8843 [Trichinella nelsoni]
MMTLICIIFSNLLSCASLEKLSPSSQLEWFKRYCRMVVKSGIFLSCGIILQVFSAILGIFPCLSNDQHMHKLMNVKGQLRARNFGRQIRKRDSVVKIVNRIT